MIKLLVIADDFTGALDTGVKFAAAGASTRVLTDLETDLTMDCGAEIVVFCAPTRHLPPEEAYSVVRRITERAAAAGIPCIFKKTDSALRGNIGAELTAALDGSGAEALHFLPAFPDMNRITVDSVAYIDGVPVSQSVFGQDPFEPVTESCIPNLIALQSKTPVVSVAADSYPVHNASCIYVYDAQTNKDLQYHAAALHRSGDLRLVAGCAGLANVLPPFLGITGNVPDSFEPQSELTVICGSVNAISRSQMDTAERGGAARYHIPPDALIRLGHTDAAPDEALLAPILSSCASSDFRLFDAFCTAEQPVTAPTDGITLEQIRQYISTKLGEIGKALLDRGLKGRLMIIGGDTLLAFLKAVKADSLTPVCEPAPGVVLVRLRCGGRTVEVLTKSGGFGGSDLLLNLRSS